MTNNGRRLPVETRRNLSTHAVSACHTALESAPDANLHGALRLHHHLKLEFLLVLFIEPVGDVKGRLLSSGNICRFYVVYSEAIAAKDFAESLPCAPQ